MPAPVISAYRDAAATVQASASVTAPAAGTALATVTIPSPGLWEVTISYYLSGTVAAGDANNLAFRWNTTPRFSPLLVPAVANAFPAPVVVVLAAAATDTVSIASIAAGTAAAVYNASLVARQVG